MYNNKKKILYICQYFYPEVFRGNDIAFHWASQGHNVHVLTGIPNYPEGDFFKGYNYFSKRHENINGVKVTRLPIVPRKKNKICLILNYFSYFILSTIYILFHSLSNKYDCIFVQQLSPVMMSVPGILYKKLYKVPLYTWVLDLWPESIKIAGNVTNKHIIAFFDLFVRSEYKNSDILLVSSLRFKNSILKYGAYENKIVYFPQWADNVSINQELNAIVPELKKGFNIMFAGNIGESQDFECIMKAADLTKSNKCINWIIIGDGRKYDWVKKFIKDNNLSGTVNLLGRFPAEVMPLLFRKANVMLLPLKDSQLFNLYTPAKLSAYMASSKPIIGMIGGEGRDIIEKVSCGWTVTPGDAMSLANLVTSISKMDTKELEERGKNGFEYYLNNFSKEKSLNKLDLLLNIN